MSEITDEMVEVALQAAHDNFLVNQTCNASCTDSMMRAALEAVAPRLQAQGMRKAAKICGEWESAGAAETDILAKAFYLEKSHSNPVSESGTKIRS